jgi:hypothetical protein
MKVKSLIVIGCLAACMVCPAVFAQEEAPAAEFFGGLSIMTFEDKDCAYNPKGSMAGWGLGLALNLNSSFAVKADLNGNYSAVKTSGGDKVEGSGINQHNIMGGIQYTKRYEDINIFAEALGGFARVSEKMTSSHEHSYKGFAMAFGGGVDWKISPGIGWRIAQVDYIPSRWNDRFHHNVRIQTGVLIPLGK